MNGLIVHFEINRRLSPHPTPNQSIHGPAAAVGDNCKISQRWGTIHRWGKFQRRRPQLFCDTSDRFAFLIKWRIICWIRPQQCNGDSSSVRYYSSNSHSVRTPQSMGDEYFCMISIGGRREAVARGDKLPFSGTGGWH
uniref:Secreted protein n=1 Tax=Globodera rostochiensis TaxID=31243 RepID=A0A914H8C9_GLORO